MKTSTTVGSLFRARNAVRSDSDRFKHLLSTDSFDLLCEAKRLHPHLKEGLRANNFKFLTTLQREAINEGIIEGKHMLLRGANGTGKTLAYLLPVLNDLYMH